MWWYHRSMHAPPPTYFSSILLWAAIPSAAAALPFGIVFIRRMSTEGSNVSKLSGTMLLEKSPQDYNDICGDCHSLFQIRAMVHDESRKVSLATTAALDIHCLLEKQHQWFASFQEIGHDANSAEVSTNMEYQLDPHCERIPKEKGCGSSAPNFCNNAVARSFTCRSLAKLLVLVPSSSLLLGGRLGYWVVRIHNTIPSNTCRKRWLFWHHSWEMLMQQLLLSTTLLDDALLINGCWISLFPWDMKLVDVAALLEPLANESSAIWFTLWRSMNQITNGHSE